MEINERLIKVLAKEVIPIEEDFELDQDVRLYLEGSIAKIEEVPNYDGTKNVIYWVRGAIAQKLEDL